MILLLTISPTKACRSFPTKHEHSHNLQSHHYSPTGGTKVLFEQVIKTDIADCRIHRHHDHHNHHHHHHHHHHQQDEDHLMEEGDVVHFGVVVHQQLLGENVPRHVSVQVGVPIDGFYGNSIGVYYSIGCLVLE